MDFYDNSNYIVLPDTEDKASSLDDLINIPEKRDRVLEYVKAHDKTLEELGLSLRSRNCLYRAGFQYLSEFLFITEDEMYAMRNMGALSVKDVRDRIEYYLESNRKAIISYCDGTYVEEDGEDEELTVGNEIITLSELMEKPKKREQVLEYVKTHDKTIEELKLSFRSENCLYNAGFRYLSEFLFITEEELYAIRNMGTRSVKDVKEKICYYLESNRRAIIAYCGGIYVEEDGEEEELPADIEKITVADLMKKPAFRGVLLEYVKAHDRTIRDLGLSVRSTNCLLNAGYMKLSDFILESEETLSKLRNLGKLSLDEILKAREEYLEENRKKLALCITGNGGALFDSEYIKERIMEVFEDMAFSGLSYSEIRNQADIPDSVDEKDIKKAIGELISEKKLEYVDYRCYKVYPSFAEYTARDNDISDRGKNFIMRRLDGEVLESIAQSENLTRERVRQIVKRCTEKAHIHLKAETGTDLFDEDYYQYFYTTYDAERKVCINELGIPEAAYNYVSMLNDKGHKHLCDAADDRQIDVSLRLKILNYLNRGKLYVDGNWIDMNRSSLEKAVVSIKCRDEVSFDEFCSLYNDFLKEQDIPYDSDIYLHDDVKATRINRLSGERYLLWKQNQMLRFYDIDEKDYTELLDTLNLGAYSNIEISTLKLFRENPALMARYDIRDHYELHNLLRKIVKEGSYNDFRCGRTPDIVFGTFDLDAAVFEIMKSNAPVSQMDLAEKISEEYGYEKATVIGSYLSSLRPYLHNGIYSINMPVMSDERKAELARNLTEDFYWIDDIKKIYSSIFSDANQDEVNAFNLKQMGFSVLSKCAVQNYSSLTEYIDHLLTENDITDIAPLRKKFTTMMSWYDRLRTLKTSFEIVEFEPDRIIRIDRLESAGVTKQSLKDFCDRVYDYIDKGEYFTAKSLRQDGFYSELYELGFSDWFYGSILCIDSRFSYQLSYGTHILYKGVKAVSIGSFARDCIKKAGSIDLYELQMLLDDRYGCGVDETYLIGALNGTDIYYDSFLQRFYANEEMFYKELDDEKEMN